VYDDTQMVTSYVPGELLSEDEVLNRLQTFLCRMGREADQGEVGIVINSTYFGIVDYEEEGEA
jgi:hypothetical protein